ncbi:keratin, type I cytoskeletal 15 [Bactrocera oleae]|uniref:keratin, type I cytoskeletal 15 n=1 Tax=Bactrocera oleae TaxID=104688 RepID=UPI0006B84B07|nr:putative glycine-rich cell wall structural protein 1 [Bactrocera oleae]XP_036214145.1 putative glycine-rich cell wall structural protein 1 isoform X1 [Bactrocera oleae]
MRSIILIAFIGTVLSIMMHRCNAGTPVTSESSEMSVQPFRYMSRRAAQGGGGGAGGGAGAGMGFGFGANMGGQAGAEGGGQSVH